MPIVLAPLNVWIKVLKLLVDEKTKKHFESLGLIPDTLIKVISNNNGNVIILIKNGRLALDRVVASKIIVG